MAKKKVEPPVEAPHFADLLGMAPPPPATPEEDFKIVRKSPFDYINAISHSKENLIEDEDGERDYNPFIVNRGLSFGPDTVIFANEMNSRPHINKRAQFMFLCASIRAKKRFNKWVKADKIENLDLVKQFFGYSTPKALDALRILTPAQLDEISERMNPGG